MKKSILITGATDGIGLETAKMLVSKGHEVLVHGRNPSKLEKAVKMLSAIPGGGPVESYLADLSDMAQAGALADEIVRRRDSLDVLINNAGVYVSSAPVTADGLDVRFAVNAIAPFLLTRRLLPLLGNTGRVVNLSSAAQAPVDLQVLAGRVRLPDGPAYAQSKLALTMWSRHMALSLKEQGPAIIAVNSGSMLGTKLVKQAFGVAGSDLRMGADILCRAALLDEFAAATGQYFDNDSGRIAPPHPDALDPGKSQELVRVIEAILSRAAHQ